MTTPDIAGLSNRNPATFPTNDPTNPLHRLADDLQRGRLKVEGVKEDVTYALSTLERQAAEIERLREALEEAEARIGVMTGRGERCPQCADTKRNCANAIAAITVDYNRARAALLAKGP